MARKRRTPAPAASPPYAPAAAPAAGEATGSAPVVAILALTMALAPALGVPNELMLQDTLKSIIVSFAALGAALIFFLGRRRQAGTLRWHGVLWLPLLLMAHALASMAWSHAYLAGVEAIRWFVFALLLWLGLNSFSRERLPWLARGIHAGAVVASLWAALQFWFAFSLWPQGPNPASTFVNRNFFAEFVVCTLPFGALLLARTRQSSATALLAASLALVVTAILMTGTRAALLAMWLLLLLVLPFIGWRYRAELGLSDWQRGRAVLAAGVFIATIAALGVLPSSNPKILEEERGASALERGFGRTASISPTDASLNVRKVMWTATLGVIADRPVTGVGAGAWEVQIPRYQTRGAQLETDYYVHNEFLQLLAEYGLVGWMFLLGLAAYLLWAAARTLRDGGDPAGRGEGPWRAVALASLLALMIVSNVGFPWRMAATGALFALALAVLAASDARLGVQVPWASRQLPWRPTWAVPALGATGACLALATYITHQAAEAEAKIVRASQIALTITRAGDWNHPRWNGAKAEMLDLVREGIAINPHYRKITPMVGDELARWGDWKNATWVWESVLQSRPYVVALITNAGRGYTSTDQPAKAFQMLERAKRVAPDAPAVTSLEVILLSRLGRQKEALEISRRALAEGRYDIDLLTGAFLLGWHNGDPALAERAMALRMREFPETQLEGWVQLGHLRAGIARDEQGALQAWRKALQLAPPAVRPRVLEGIPPAYRERLAAG
ncbi:MAG TPA: O-antigen ligase family protein [Ramlibacter sp.]|nr:O-antigen ligase family protein [Ramlibacter sp.]